MKIIELKETAKNLIAKNQLDKALTIFIENKGIFSENYRNQIITLSRRYAAIQTQENLDTLDKQAINIEKNQITLSFLKIIDKIEKDPFNDKVNIVSRRTLIGTVLFTLGLIIVNSFKNIYIFFFGSTEKEDVVNPKAPVDSSVINMNGNSNTVYDLRNASGTTINQEIHSSEKLDTLKNKKK
jgi:hypothetical protein